MKDVSPFSTALCYFIRPSISHLNDLQHDFLRATAVLKAFRYFAIISCSIRGFEEFQDCCKVYHIGVNFAEEINNYLTIQ